MKFPDVAIEHILYTTEFSENAQIIRAYATTIAKQFKAKLTLLHVIPEEVLDVLIFDAGMDRRPGIEKRLEISKEQYQDAKKAVMDKIKKEYGAEIENEVDIVIEKGNPVTTINKVAEDRNCGLIVMGIKGKGTSKLENATMGDTVRRVLHRSKIPVLVVQNKLKTKK